MFWELVCAHGQMLSCIKICDAAWVLQFQMHYIDGYFISILTCLAVMLCSFCNTVLLLSLSHLSHFSSQPWSVTCTASVLQGGNIPLLTCPLLNFIWQQFPLSPEKSQDRVAVFLVKERELAFARGIIPQEIWEVLALPLPSDPVLGTFASFLLLSKVLRLVVESKRSPAAVL